MIAGELEIRLMAGIARLQADMDRANRIVDDSTNRMGHAAGIAKAALGAIAGALSVGAFAAMIKGSIDASAGLHDMSIQTGASVASLMALRSVAATSDTSIEGIAAAMNKLAKGMAVANEDSKGMGQAIKSLGLDFDALQAMAPEQQMITIANALSKVEDGGRKSAVAMTLFKGEGAKMLPFLADLAEQSDDVTAKLTKQEIATRKLQAALADEFGDNIAKIVEVSEEWKRELSAGITPALVEASAEILKAANSAGGLGEAIKRMSADGTFAAWTKGLVDGVKALAAAVVPAAKVAAAYFAIFVAAPAIYAAAVAALTPVVGAIAIYTMNVLIGQAATLSWSGTLAILNTSLFGTSVAANLASGAISKMYLAGSLLFAAFAGWQIGKFLTEEDINVFGLFTIKANEMRVAGLAFVGAILKGWEHVKYGAEMAWEGIKFAWDTTVNAMKTAFADYLSVVSRGLSSIRASGVSKQVAAYAESLRASAGAQKTFAEQTAGISAAHDKAIDAIDTNITELVAFELTVKAVASAETAAIKPKKAIVAATDEQKKAYRDAVKSANDFIEAMKIEGSQIGLGADQIKMMAAAREAAKAPEAAQRKQIMELALANDIATKAVTAKADADKLAADAQKDSDAGIATINAETQALLFKIKTHGMLPAAITAARIAELEASQQSTVLTDAGIADIQRRIDALKGLAAAQTGEAGLDSSTSVTQAKDLLEIMVQIDEATRSAADGMVASFGRVGAAIGGLTTALSGYGRTQAAIAAKLAADKAADPKNIAKLEIAAANASAQAKIKSYGDMAGAAKGFFKENSKGYKVLETTEKAFRAYEMALAIQTMLTKSGLLTAFTGLFVGAKAAETAATVASIAPDVAASQIKGQAAATAGVAGQAQGDPYTAWARMAAMIAVMGALGYAVSGSKSSGGISAADAQKAQGSASFYDAKGRLNTSDLTGGVFGDASAKSNSIGNSIEMMEKYSGALIPINLGMLSALRAIEASMVGLTNLVVRVPGLVEGTNLGIQTGQLNAYGTPTDDVSKFMTGLTKLTVPGFGGKVAGFINNLWGKVKANIVDSGLQFGGSVNDLQAGKGFNQFASVDVTKSSAFGLKKKTSNRVETAGLDSELSSQFALVFKNLEASLGEAAKAMGGTVGQVTSVLDKMTISMTSVSLKGLSGDDLTAAINSVLSKTMDQMASAVFPALDSFRKVGEGYAETVMRLASNYAVLDQSLESIGTTFGATGLSSLRARENLISMAGGIDALAEQASSYADNFLTEGERLAPVQKYVTDTLALMGMTGLKTREDFKAAVRGLADSGALATEAGAKTFTGLMALQQAFAAVTPPILDLTKSIADIASESTDLQDQIDELTMTRVQLLERERKTYDPSNRALFDHLQAIKAMREAQDSTKSSLGDVISRMKSFGDSARSLRDSLLMGALTTLTPEQQYAEARRQRDATRAAALGGDAAAQSNLSAMQTAFLTISQKVNGGDSQYSADFASVLQMSDEIAKWSSGQVDVAQASLDALNAQVLGIANLNATMMAVSGGIDQLAGTPNYSTMGTSDKEALVSEIKALRTGNEGLIAEVKGLRADQQKQTGALIESNGRVTLAAAERVVSGSAEIETDASWSARNSGLVNLA